MKCPKCNNELFPELDYESFENSQVVLFSCFGDDVDGGLLKHKFIGILHVSELKGKLNDK